MLSCKVSFDCRLNYTHRGMDYEEKYVKLKPEGVVKRVDDTIQKLEKYDLHNKGLSKSLKVLKKILEDDLPRLKETVEKRLSWSNISTVITISLGLIMALLVFMPDPTQFNVNAEITAKASFINASMSIVVGLFVLNFSISAWLKRQLQTEIRKTTDKLHELLHRIDMFQMGKTKEQIIDPESFEGKNYLICLDVYLTSIATASDCIQKAAVIIYHQTDDDSITSGARHLETVSGALVDRIRTRWQMKNY